MSFKVGDFVMVGKVQERGTIRFIGETKFSAGEWVGVELDNPAGKNDGTVLDHRYFECPQQHGIFVRATALTKAQPVGGTAAAAAATAAAAAALSSAPAGGKAAAPKRASTLTDKQAQPKRTTSALKEAGSAKVAPPSPRASATASAPPAAAQASKQPVAASPSPPAAAAASASVPPASVAKAAPETKSAAKAAMQKKAVSFPAHEVEADQTDCLSAFKEDQRIAVFGQPGIVRFVGPTKFADSIWVGIEFDEEIGRCDGSVQGVSYFRCKPGHGMFLLAPMVDAEAIKPKSGMAMGRNASSTTRRGSFRQERRESRMISTASSAGLGEIQTGDDPGLEILDEDGNVVDIEDLIQAFEQSREELEGVQELLDEAHEREREMRQEVKDLRAAAARGAPPPPESKSSSSSNPFNRQLSSVQPQVSSLLSIAGASGVDIFDNIILLTDSGRVGHHLSYPPGTETIYSYFECSGGRYDEVCFFGLQYYLKKYLVGQVVTVDKINTAEGFFRDHFAREQFAFDKRIFNRIGWEYILKQHDGRLPLVIKALPEGTVVPIKQTLLTVENTDPKCFWLTSYLESLLSQLWFPVTICTQSRAQKNVILKSLQETGAGEASYRFKLHDFGFRDTAGAECSALGGLGHLVSFSSSDTLSALLLARDYYSADCAATSMPSGDGSMIRSWGEDSEVDALRAMIKTHPTGFVACTSDAHDALNACNSIWCEELKPLIEKRDGCVLVKLDVQKSSESLLRVLEALAGKFGSDQTSTGHKLLPSCIRVMQSQGVDPTGLETLLESLKQQGWAADNVSFGCTGAWQMLSSGAQRFAFKCSHMKISGKDVDLAADSESRAGRLTVECNDGQWSTVAAGAGDASKDRLVEVFRNGKLLIDDTLGAIRKRSEGAQVSPRPADILVGSPSTGRRGKPPSARPPPGRPANYKATVSELKEKSQQVKNLSEEMLEKAGKLKAIQARRAEGKVSAADVNWMSQIFEEHKTDLGKLADLCGMQRSLLESSPPVDGADFARKLLSGGYTGERSDAARAGLKARLQDALKSKKSMLKRTTTKEMNGVASSEEVDLVAILYTKYQGNFDTIATECGISRSMLDKYAPVDAKDFGRKLLSGFYTENADDVAKANLRVRLQDQIMRQVSQLRRTQTKEATGAASEEDIERVAKIFRDNRGNLDMIARICGASISLLKRRPPNDAEDFAKCLLEGVYTGDSSSVAKAELRERLREDLQVTAQRLKRTTTKEMSGPSDVEVAAVAKFFTQYNGDLQKISEECGLSLPLLQASPPSDPFDFGRKLLMGLYTADQTDVARAHLRDTLVQSILARKSTLRRTETKTGSELSEVELEFAGKIFTANSGDLSKIAAACGISLALLKKSPPANSKDFAKKLYDGLYVAEQSDTAKAELRSRLRQDLMGQISKLKPAVVKEANMVLSKIELDKFARVYTQCRGNAEVLAQRFSLNADLIKKSPPEDANDFARKLLDGAYTGDSTQLAKASLRERLREDLQVKVSQLKRTETNAGKTAGPIADDVRNFADVFQRLSGDMSKLAELFDIDAGLLSSKPPKDAEDFAQKLLNGDYTGDQTELARKFLKTRLKKKLQEQISCLKRTTTREAITEPEASDLDLVAQVFTKLGGNLEKLATKIGLDAELLHSKPPADAMDFARKLFAGAYQAESSAKAQQELRSTLRQELQRQSTMLKRTTTKEMSGEASEEDIAAVAKVYTDSRGNLDTLASLTGCNIELLRKRPPADAEDFASKLLEGVYTGDSNALVLRQLRDRLREDLQSQASRLKRTKTKEFSGPAQSDLDSVAAIYTSVDGDMEKLLERFQLNRVALVDSAPSDAEEFARGVLEGRYTKDATEHAKAQLRDSLGQDLQRQSSKLKRTTTKESMGEASPDDVQQLSKVYMRYSGDLPKLAEACGISKDLLTKRPPENATDFATRLLSGSFNADKSEEAKTQLRSTLQEKLVARKSTLRRANTKEFDGSASPEDIMAMAKVFAECNGDLDKIAKKCSIDPDLLIQSPPSSAEDFAKKFLEGQYTGCSAELAKKALREILLEDLQIGAAQLRRTTTKEVTGPLEEDIEAAAGLYRQYNGDLVGLANLAGIEPELLEASPPESPEDFARSLLTGAYSVDQSAVAKERLRERLREEIGLASSQLKRTTTKEAHGEATAEDIELFAKAYNRAMGRGGGGLEALAKMCQVSVDVVKRHEPKHAEDFARKVLDGTYSPEGPEAAKRELRDDLRSSLKKTMSCLKRTVTREATGESSAEDIAAVSWVFMQYQGNLDSLAEVFGASADLMRRSNFSTSEDFAHRLLQGEFTGDMSAAAQATLRERLRVDINAQRSKLKRTTTREAQGPKARDIEVISKLFMSYKGDIDTIAEQWGISADLVYSDPPRDANDFAWKLLEGRYTKDLTRAAKAEFRQSLHADISRCASKLRRTTTKEVAAASEPDREDVARLAIWYENNGGDLDKIAHYTDTPKFVFERNLPKDAVDFAKKMLSGAYTCSAEELAKSDLRKDLAIGLRTQMSSLKRTNTKENVGPTEEDLEYIATVFDHKGGDGEVLARLFGQDPRLLIQQPPSDRLDFARRLLEGQYLGDATESLKAELRNRLAEDIVAQKSRLKRTTTKEAGEPNEEYVQAISRVYDKHRGNLATLANAVGIYLEVLERHPPTNARDFALKLLSGQYTMHMDQVAKANLRNKLKDEINDVAGQLRRTTTKEYTGEPSEEDIACVASLYTANGGDLEKLVESCYIPRAAFDRNPPKDARDFAIKFLKGLYAPDEAEASKADLRKTMKEEIMTTSSKLKRTTTKEAAFAISEDDVAAVAALYEAKGGDLAKLASATGGCILLMNDSPPKDAKDFASKLLEGAYSTESAEAAQKLLISKLREDLSAGREKLKRTETKGAAGPTEEDLILVSTIFTRCRGDLSRISKACSVPKELLEAKPPTCALDFAKNLLDGAYSGSMTEKDKAQLQDKLAKSKKRRDEKKDAVKASFAPTPEQVALIEKLYNRSQGDLEKVAQILNLPEEVLEANPPTDAADFAKKLLEGTYCADNNFGDMRTQLVKSMSILRRTKTKECTGEAEPEDVRALAKLYERHSGDLPALARACGLIPELLTAQPPADGRDFAKKLLEGAYQGDINDLAKAQLRSSLGSELLRKASTLRRTTTKENTGPSEDEIGAVSKIYSELKGNTKALVDKFGICLQRFKDTPPANAREFAQNIFSGLYLVDKTEDTKAQLRERLQEEIGEASSRLKRTNTKEATGEASKEDIEQIAKFYTTNDGDPDKISLLCYISADLMRKFPPKDPEDFARKLLAGSYNVDQNEAAKSRLRGQLAGELAKQRSQLKRTTTKECMDVIQDEDIWNFSQLFFMYSGDLGRIAEACGVNPNLLAAFPPVDAEDFARKLLMGIYTGDNSDLARTELRYRMREELQVGMSQLRRTTTKEAMFAAAPEDVQALTSLYHMVGGDLKEIAQLIFVPVEVLERTPPKNAEDFACKLLAGHYAFDDSELAKATLRENLGQELTRSMSTLKRTNTKEGPFEVAPEEIKLIADLYDSVNGNLDQLSESLLLSRSQLEKHMPTDGEDFARKLIEGVYTSIEEEEAKADLRKHLEEGVNEKRGQLKRTTTKEAMGVASEEDMCAVEELYRRVNGSLDKLAARCGVSIELLRAKPPTDGRDFAKRLLAGAYSLEAGAEPSEAIVKNIREELLERKTTLRRTTTKNYSGIPKEDLEAMEKLYSKYNGDLKELAKVCGVPLKNFMRDLPKDARDFANKLLIGAYTPDLTESAKAQLRQRLAEDLKETAQKLKRTTTKEYSGPSQQDVEWMEKVYNDAEGDLDRLARAIGAPPEALAAKPPKDANDFALSALTGFYSQDSAELAKRDFRNKLQGDLEVSASQLKRTTTKERFGEVTDDDVQFWAHNLVEHSGKLKSVAKVLGVNADLMQEYAAGPTLDFEDFAKKLLQGAFQGDDVAIARQSMLKTLGQDLQRSSTSIRRTVTREMTFFNPADSDLRAIEALWVQNNGDSGEVTDLVEIAKLCGVDPELFVEHRPKGKSDFAQQLLSGAYSVEGCAGDQAPRHKASSSKAEPGFAFGLQKTISGLKRTVTRTCTGLQDEEIAAVAAVYRQNGGDLRKLAQLVDINAEVLLRDPPASAEDFAAKLLAGQYAVDSSEVQKKDLRASLAGELKRQASSLKRTNTKEASGPKHEDVALMAKLFEKHGGDLDQIADALSGISRDRLKANPPTDAKDFAKRLLDGAYTTDSTAEALAQWRRELQTEVLRSVSTLKRTSTKEWDGKASEEDLDAVAKLYEDNKGDLEKLASSCGLGLELLRSAPPSSARDFAEKLLSGEYTGDSSALAQKQLRSSLTMTLKDGTTPSLKRVATKEYSGEADTKEVAAVAKVIMDLNQDWEQVSRLFGVSAELMRATAGGTDGGPEEVASATAAALLKGLYSDETSEQIRVRLKDSLAAELKRTASSLRRTTTKESLGLPQQVDIDALARLYMEHDGNLDRLAALTGGNANFMRMAPPDDATDFARKFLKGFYSD